VAGIAETIPVWPVSGQRTKRLEDAGFVVVGEAQDGASGLAAATAMRPAVVLRDVQRPDIDGFQDAARLTGQDDGPAVVRTSRRDGGELSGMVARSGALGFVPKDELSGPAHEALLG
jgi:two-component system response regulator EvgA